MRLILVASLLLVAVPAHAETWLKSYSGTLTTSTVTGGPVSNLPTPPPHYIEYVANGGVPLVVRPRDSVHVSWPQPNGVHGTQAPFGYEVLNTPQQVLPIPNASDEYNDWLVRTIIGKLLDEHHTGDFIYVGIPTERRVEIGEGVVLLNLPALNMHLSRVTLTTTNVEVINFPYSGTGPTPTYKYYWTLDFYASPGAIPEPATLLLVSTSALALVLRRARR